MRDRPGGVLRLVLGDGLWLTGIGLVIGALAATAAAPAMSHLLFGIRSFDLATFATAIGTLLAIAVSSRAARLTGRPDDGACGTNSAA
jgi:Na+/phosphate symporter